MKAEDAVEMIQEFVERREREGRRSVGWEDEADYNLQFRSSELGISTCNHVAICSCDLQTLATNSNRYADTRNHPARSSLILVCQVISAANSRQRAVEH